MPYSTIRLEDGRLIDKLEENKMMTTDDAEGNGKLGKSKEVKYQLFRPLDNC